jgi:hypothetical protein
VKPVSQGRLKAGIASVAVAAVCLLFISTLPRSAPYRIGAARLSGWKLVMEPGGTAFIALQPPPELSADLFRQAVQRTGMALVAPEHPSIPLILQSEYEDSLQGVLSTEDVVNLARDTGVDTAPFKPVCIARRSDTSSGRPRDLWFAVFESPKFDQFRLQLSPLFPEQAGAAPFEPTTLSPVLPIAGTDDGFARWWPIATAPADCLDSVRID